VSTVAALRTAIADCVAKASSDAPADCERRLAIFIARLSGSMESLGEHEIDAMLCGLFDHDPSIPYVEPRLSMANLAAA